MMRRSCIALAAAALAAPVGAAEVVGTAYTVLLRGYGPQQPTRQVQPQQIVIPGLNIPIRQPRQQRQPPQPTTGTAATATMRLVDSRTGQPIASANHDPSIDGYMFRLPMNIDRSRGDVCLVIKNAGGASLAVRSEVAGDTGHAFRNPAWSAETARLAEAASIRAEHAALVAALDRGAREIESLQVENGSATSAEQCQPGPPQADPPQPPGALEPTDATKLGGAVCALAWQRSFERTGIDPSRLFGEAGLAADWSNRNDALSIAQSLPPVQLELRDNDARTIPDAATKGRAYLEHAEGVRALVRVHSACKAEVVRLAAAEMQSWQTSIAAARNAPERAKAQCAQRFAQIEQLRTRLSKGPAFRQELERRMAALDAAAPTGTESERIDVLSCKTS